MINIIFVGNQAYLRYCILNSGYGNTGKFEIKKILWDFTSALSVSGRDNVLHSWTLFSFLLHCSNCSNSRGEEAQSARRPRLIISPAIIYLCFQSFSRSICCKFFIGFVCLIVNNGAGSLECSRQFSSDERIACNNHS